MNLNGIMKEILIINEDHGFTSKVPDSNPSIFSEKMLLVISEISEALEEFRSGRGLREIYFDSDTDGKPEGIPIEIADAVIRLFDFCAANGIDLEHAIRIKVDYNTTRPYKHGKKF